MRLLVVTDHRFIADPSGAIWDTYCFDRKFFDDYARIFDEVRVAARVRTEATPVGASRSNGDGIRFVRLTDIQGGRWAASPPRRYREELPAAVAWADAVCVRIPSISGVHAARWARCAGKPVMFELIGDPFSTVQGREHGLATRGFGAILAAATWALTRRATVGSYVSRSHLQRRYPIRRGAPSESISSIRLPEADIRPPRRFFEPPAPLRLILVASLVPVKDHATLLAALAQACERGADAHLALCGGGPLRDSLESQARALSIAERVTFHGHINSRERLNQLTDAADLFVMTSISEGMPRAMIEAMARGLPCIGTQAGGIGELLDAGASVGVGESRALGSLIADLAEAPDRLTAMAAHSHETARTFVDSELSARRLRLLTALRAAARPR